MKRLAFFLTAFVVMQQANASELQLKRVVLSTSGLVQFTHQGQVEPGKPVELSVRLDQVDDVLKSLTIFDRANAIGAVSLPGKSPLSELFRDLPFNADALNSLPALLNALVGAEVEIEGEVTAKGRIFRVEDDRVQLPSNGGQTVRHRLTLLTDKGLVQAVLEDLSSVRFVDAQAKAQIDRALAGVAQNRAKERRTVSISMLGDAAREIGLTYIVAAPVWKTAYRIVLPKEGGRARLQGWGVIENLTGSDWKDVELSLISGNPVALKQALYSAFYVDRPEIPVSTATRLVPRQDQAEEQSRLRKAFPAAPAPGVRAAGAVANKNYFTAQRSPAMDAQEPAPEDISGSALTASSEEAATQVIFRFPGTLSLASGSTMMVPFFDREIGATRTWLFQPETNDRRPLAAVRLRNDSDAALPGGIITAFDTGGEGVANFVGDAQLPVMPKGSFKFVTFALDSKTDIRRISKPIKATRLGKVVKGELSLTVRSRWTIDYEISAPVDEDREIVIDEPRADGWTTSGDNKDVEETASRLRYKVFSPKGKTTRAALVRERTELETVTLAGLDPDQLLATVSGLENDAPALRAAIAKLGELVARLNQITSRHAELDNERKKIGEDQDRVRRNLAAVGQGSDLGRRYIDSLRAQEDRVSAIASEEKALDADATTTRKAAEEVAMNLTL